MHGKEDSRVINFHPGYIKSRLYGGSVEEVLAFRRLGADIGVSAPVTITVSCDALPRLRLCCDGESRPLSAGVSARVSSRVVFIAGNRVREMIEDSEFLYIRLLLSVQRDFSCVGGVLASRHDTTVHECHSRSCIQPPRRPSTVPRASHGALLFRYLRHRGMSLQPISKFHLPQRSTGSRAC